MLALPQQQWSLSKEQFVCIIAQSNPPTYLDNAETKSSTKNSSRLGLQASILNKKVTALKLYKPNKHFDLNEFLCKFWASSLVRAAAASLLSSHLRLVCRKPSFLASVVLTAKCTFAFFFFSQKILMRKLMNLWEAPDIWFWLFL